MVKISGRDPYRHVKESSYPLRPRDIHGKGPLDSFEQKRRKEGNFRSHEHGPYPHHPAPHFLVEHHLPRGLHENKRPKRFDFFAPMMLTVTVAACMLAIVASGASHKWPSVHVGDRDVCLREEVTTSSVLKMEMKPGTCPHPFRVLWLAADSDHNGAMRKTEKEVFEMFPELDPKNDPTRGFLATVVDSPASVRSVLEKEANKGNPANLIVINAHGDRGEIMLGDHQSISKENVELAGKFFAGFAPGATIVLFSCSTGQGGETPSIAERLAQSSGMSVVAPNSETSASVRHLVNICPLELRMVTYEPQPDPTCGNTLSHLDSCETFNPPNPTNSFSSHCVRSSSALGAINPHLISRWRSSGHLEKLSLAQTAAYADLVCSVKRRNLAQFELNLQEVDDVLGDQFRDRDLVEDFLRQSNEPNKREFVEAFRARYGNVFTRMVSHLKEFMSSWRKKTFILRDRSKITLTTS